MQFRVSALKNLWTVCCSVAKLCPFLCDPMDCSMSGFPLLPPLCPQVCSLCLCLSSFPAYRFISTIFLDSIYMHSVQFSCSVMSDSLPPHELQHARPPGPSLLPEFTQTHVHRVSDAIQPSHPLSSPFPPAPNPSQHQGLFKWVNSSHEVAKVLEFQL